jgi:hypothetical protein
MLKKRSTVQPFALLRNTQSYDATFCVEVVAGFIAKGQYHVRIIASKRILCKAKKRVFS